MDFAGKDEAGIFRNPEHLQVFARLIKSGFAEP
jgi:hypothetical protein